MKTYDYRGKYIYVPKKGLKMGYLIDFIKSFIVGICAILPGVSGSVIAVSFGLYERFIEIVTDTRKIKDNKLFLLVVIIGVICGIFLTSNLLVFIFNFKVILYYILVGIILSEIPLLIKKINDYNGKKIRYIPLILAFLFSLALDILNKSNVTNSYSVFKYFLGGILFAFGKVFPGVSSSFFLLCLGIYEDIIILVTNPFLLIKKIYFYTPFILGTIFGLLVFIKLLSYLLTNKYETIYSIIIGFMLSSVVVILPNYSFTVENIVGIILMIASFILFLYIKTKKHT